MLAPPQPGIGRDIGHQLAAVAVPPGGQRPAEPADVIVGGDLGGVDPQRRFPGHGDLRGGQQAVPGLPVHLGQPRVGQEPALDVAPAIGLEPITCRLTGGLFRRERSAAADDRRPA
jgi:hypothetical protein